MKQLRGSWTIFLALGICGVVNAHEAYAASRYVRAGATGKADGSDWANAYTNLPSSLVRGDTYYIAGGNYGSHIFNDAVSGSTLITIKKATASDHGTDTGWSATYGSSQAVFDSGFQFYSDYYLIDGMARNSDWRTGGVSQYGIRVGNTRLDNGDGVGGDNLTFRNIDFHGGGRDTGSGDDVIYGLTGNSNITFQNCALRDSDRTIFLMRGNWKNLKVDHSYLARNTSTPAIHGELLSMTDSDGVVFSNNAIEDIEGTAVFAGINNGNASNWQIYGNTVTHTDSYVRNVGRKAGHNFGIAGLVFIANDSSNRNTGNNFKVYNNTMYNIQGSYSGVVIQSGTGNFVQNNIWYNSVRTNNSFSGTLSHNFYFNTQADGDSSSSKVVCSSGCGIFVDAAARDFRLAVATQAGQALDAPFNVDPEGVIRGSDGTYDRGAFEFGGIAPSPSPSATVTSTPTPTPSPSASPSPSPSASPSPSLPAAPQIISFNASSSSITSGQTATLSWSVSGSNVSLMLNPGSINVSGTGSRVVSPSATTTYTLTASNSGGSVSKSVAVTVSAVVVNSQTLFTSQVPASLTNNDGVSYELGMRFKASVAGKIRAIRFYKSSRETGTHVGKIYSASGALLAQVTFTSESGSGWQRVQLSTPLSIAASTEYIVSVNTGGGYYVATVEGLATQVRNGKLRSVATNAGVYGPVGSKPTSSWKNSNYFRDVEFSQN